MYKKRLFSYTGFFLVVLLTVLSACDKDKDCTTDYTDAVQLGFKKVQPNTVDPSIMDTVALSIPFDSVYARRNHDPRKIIFQRLINVPNQSTYALPVHVQNDNHVDTLNYYFVRGSETKVLSFSYRQRQEFVSEYCGMLFVYDQLKVISSDFPKTKVLYSDLSRFNKINIECFPKDITTNSN